MTGLKKIILGITDLKTLFQSIRSKYDLDFSNFALSSFKRRLEDFMFQYHIKNFDELVHKIENDLEFFHLFIASQFVDSTEMFRDPEFWDELKNLVLKRYKHNQEIKVWIPDCNSGEEFYTFQIVNSQLEYSNKTRVCVSTFCSSNIERILKGNQDTKKMEINLANFDRYELGGNLADYFISKVNIVKLKPEFLENVDIMHHNLFVDKIPGIFDLILFRNKMLYYNPQLKIEALKKLDTALKPGGYIAVGIKESFDYPSWEQDYTIVSESEKIYRKY